MLAEFERWTEDFALYDSLESLRGRHLGIDAGEYVRTIYKLQFDGIHRKIFEELPSALGGLPFGYKAVIEATVKTLRELDIKPYFVFSGLSAAIKDPNAYFARYEEAMRMHGLAWKSYDSGDGQTAVELFGKSEYTKPEDLFRLVQETLQELGVKYLVAPYGSCAQLAWMQRAGTITGIWGPSDALMFDCDDVITKIDFKKKEFTFVEKKQCLARLGNIHPNMFIDACLLAGCEMIPTLPWIETHTRKPTKIQTAVEELQNSNGSGYVVCMKHAESTKHQALNYTELYKWARMVVQHHVVMKSSGAIVVLDERNAPRVHDFLTQRLPDELLGYMSRGLIGPRVLNWRASHEILEPPPLDNGESEAYRVLVQEQLREPREAAISLLSHSLHRFYQHKDMRLRCWFDKEEVTNIMMRDLVSPRPKVESWKVTEDIFRQKVDKYHGRGLIFIAVQSLTDTDFAARTIAPKDPKVHSPRLKTKNEILLNAIWRMLQLRGYVNDDHTLSPWGKILSATLSSMPSDWDEAAILAVELARYGYLTYENFFPNYSGISPNASDQTRKNIVLLSRVACLGKFRHEQIGFTGALSRQLLGFNSMITAVRHSLRDLAEVCMTTMYLNNEAERKQMEGMRELGLHLPFLVDNDCGLGSLVNYYLYQLYSDPNTDPADEKAKHDARDVTKGVFSHCMDVDGDLNKAFKLWDAVRTNIFQSQWFPRRFASVYSKSGGCHIIAQNLRRNTKKMQSMRSTNASDDSAF